MFKVNGRVISTTTPLTSINKIRYRVKTINLFSEYFLFILILQMFKNLIFLILTDKISFVNKNISKNDMKMMNNDKMCGIC